MPPDHCFPPVKARAGDVIRADPWLLLLRCPGERRLQPRDRQRVGILRAAHDHAHSEELVRHAWEGPLFDTVAGFAHRCRERLAVRAERIDLRVDDRRRRQATQVGYDQVQPWILRIGRTGLVEIPELLQHRRIERLGVRGIHPR